MHYHNGLKKSNNFLLKDSLSAFLHVAVLILQLQIFFFKKDMYVYKSKWQNATVVLGHNIPLQLDY